MPAKRSLGGLQQMAFILERRSAAGLCFQRRFTLPGAQARPRSALALLTLLLAGCQPAQQGNPAAPAAGLTESQQRWMQIQGMQADPRTRIRDPNPTVMSVNPQAFGITPPTGDGIPMR